MTAKILSRWLWLIISAIVLAYVVTLIGDISPYVRGPIEWRWPRWPSARWEQVWPLLVALTLIGLGVRWIDRRAQQQPQKRWLAIGVALLIILAPLVQLLALRVDKLNPFEALFDRAVDPGANSYFSASLRFRDLGQTLRTYPQLMPKLDVHAQVHPPGVPLLYWIGVKAFEESPGAAQLVATWFRRLECNDIGLIQLPNERLASALVGMFLPVLANMLTVWCVYQLSQKRFGPRAGLYGAAMWVVVPSAVLFPGAWALVYPCLAGLTWLAVDAGLARRQARWFLLAGLLMSVSTFLELGTAALGLFLTLYIVTRYVLERRNPLRDWRFLLSGLIAALIGVFSMWIGYQLLYGVSLKQIVEAMYPIHVGYEFDRVTWLINHPYEFAVFVGLPVFCLAVAAFARNLTTARSRRGTLRGAALSLSFLISWLVLVVIDPARDETPRTWMLFMPLTVVVASQFFASAQPQPERFGWLWGLMVVQVVSMLAILQVMLTGLYGLPPRETVAAVPSHASPTQADFGGMVQLIGYDAQRDSENLNVDWYWRNTAAIDRPYVVFNHLVSADWLTYAQLDEMPQRGRPLMTCWQIEEIYRDTHTLTLPPDLPPGQYFLEMGLVDPQTGARVPVTNADGVASDHVEMPVDALR